MLADVPVTEAEPVAGEQRPADRGRWLAVRLPAALLGLLFVLIGLFIATQADAYGRTYDESLQDHYGYTTLAWYLSGGEDTTFLQYHPSLLMPQHGPFMETIVAAVQNLTHEQWTTRGVVTAVVAALGVAAVALCGFELGGWWMALLAATGLALYPRYMGAVFNNSKDVPLAAAMIVVLWLALRMVRRWGRERAYLLDSVLVGVAIGAAASIRVVAIVWYGVLGVLVVGWWLRHGRAAWTQGRWRAELARQAIAAALVGTVSVLTMCALWPYVFLDPVRNLADSISAMSRFPWIGMVPLGDERYPSNDLPRRYIFEWLVVGSPPPVVLFAVVGGLLAVAHIVRIRTGHPGVMLAGLYFGVPVAALLVINPTMYNGLRHFLFVVPAFVLLAAYGFVRSLAFLARQRLRVLAGFLAALTLLTQVQAVATMARIHPYEYAYFSPVVGGIPGAAGRYEVDYWGTCNKPAAEWLVRNYRDHVTKSPGELASVRTSAIPFLAFEFLPPTEFGYEPDDPDFYIWSMHEWDDDEFPSYVPIHVVKVDGHTICVVKKRA